MKIEPGEFYPANLKVNGAPEPSYFYIIEATGSKVKFKVTDRPDSDHILTAGIFTMDESEFMEMMEEGKVMNMIDREESNTFDGDYERITDKTMSEIMKVLDSHGIPFNLDIANEIGAAVCDGTLDALHAGQKCFSYKIGEREAKATVTEDAHGGKEITHYYWTMLAGFTDRERAEAYIDMLREVFPKESFCLFVDGIPEDYEE